jgi:hypothetical protein
VSIDKVQDLTPVARYTAGAGQSLFPYDYPIFTDPNLKVYVNDVLKTLTTHYTVAGAGNDTGGDVTFVTPMIGGEIVTIKRDIAIERLADFQQNGPNSSQAMNDELDRITMVEQQLEASIARCLRLATFAPISDAALELTPLSSWVNKFLTFGPTGIPTPALPVASPITGPIVQQFMGEWLDLGHVPTRVSDTQFSVPTDLTAIYTVGRRVRVTGSATAYGTITASVFASVTTVTVSWDSGVTPATLNTVSVGIISELNTSFPLGVILDASTTVKGKVELATKAETVTGTDATRAVTPDSLATSGSFTGTLTGMTSSTTGTIDYYQIGKRVTLISTTNIFGTSNSTGMTMTGVPSSLWPTALSKAAINVVRDNGAGVVARASINFSTGVILFDVAPFAGGGFTASGSKGLFSGWQFDYLL